MSIEQAARALGMKKREIIAIERVDDGHVITTHDGQRTLVTSDGELAGVGDGPAPAAAAAETPAAKGRQRRTRQTGKNSGGQQQTPDTSDVPDGTPEEVLAWVDGDKDRAAAAYAVEVDRAEPRDDLAQALETLAS